MKFVLEKYCPWIPLLLLCVFYTFKAIDFPIHDFSNYYFGGKFLANGHFNTQVYFPYWFNSQIASLGYNGLFTSFAPNTPFLALFFYPISFIPLATAKLVFNGISVLLFLFSLHRMAAHHKVRPVYIIMLPVLFFVPIKNELLFGQMYFLLFFLLAESVLAYEKGQHMKMAVFLSFAILLKVFPIFLILIFAFRKQYQPLLLTIAGCLFLIGISLFFMDLTVWMYYFQTVLPKASGGEIASAYVTNYQSVFMFLKEMLVFDAVENPGGFFYAPVVFSVLILAFKLGLVGVGFFVSRKSTNALVVFSYWLFVSILISPYGSTYAFITLLFPFLALLQRKISNVKKGIFIGLLLLINNFPISVFIKNPLPFSYWRLLTLVLLFGIFISLLHKIVNWKSVAFVALTSLVLLFGENKTVKSDYFLAKESPILLYDYKIENGKLTYFYWNEKGKNTQSIPLQSQLNVNLDIKNNQVYYQNKAVTSDQSNKLKPQFIDNKTILYLSDYDRGIGFYTLRKLELK